MFFLPWWTYVLIGTISFTSALAGQWLANIAEPGIKHDDEPYPCHAYLGQTPDGVNLWCWLTAGHDEDHADQFESGTETVFTREWPDEDIDVTTASDADDVALEWPVPGWVTKLQAELDDEPLPELPQRRHFQASLKAPVERIDPWPQCDDTVPLGRCRLAQAHPGLHEYI